MLLYKKPDALTALKINPLTPELNPSAQRCLPRLFIGILIFKGLTARRLYKSFGVKELRFAVRDVTPCILANIIPYVFTLKMAIVG
jgi:hypothetical protein